MTPEQSRIINQFKGRTLASGYRVHNEEPLGVGGFGAALKATYERNGQLVVVKLDTRLKDKENFLREAQTISHLRHPHIITYYWHGFEKIPHAQKPGEIEEYPYFVIAYANEGSLGDLMKREGLQPSEQSVRYLIDAADALDDAHKGNVLHRDIKPANILRNNGNILVADFGIATEAHSLSSNIMQLPGMGGTLVYMPPEQLRGDPRKQSDIYALGMVAYELFTNARPRSATTDEEYYLLNENDPVRTFTETRRQAGKDMDDVAAAHEPLIMQALQKDPRKRPPSMEEFGHTLKETQAKVVEEQKRQKRIRDMAAAEAAKPQDKRTQVETVISHEEQKKNTRSFTQPPIQPGALTNLPTITNTPPPPNVQPGFKNPSITNSPNVQTDQPIAPQPNYPYPLSTPNIPLYPVPQGQQQQYNPNVVQAPNRAVPKLPRISRRNALILLGAAGTIGGIVAIDKILTTTHEIPPGTTLEIYRGHSAYVESVTWSPDGKYIASGSDDKTVQVWNALTGKRITDYKGQSDVVTSVAWSPDGTMIASAGSIVNTVKVWNAATGKLDINYIGYPGQITSVAWSPDGKRIATGGYDSNVNVQVWDASTGNILTVFKGGSNIVNDVAWSPDGTMIASVSNETIEVWEASTGKVLTVYKGHSEEVSSVAWSPDGTMIASGSGDNTVKVWNATTGKLLTNYDHNNGVFYDGLLWTGIQSVAWSPDGTKIASGSVNPSAQVWEASTGKVLTVYKGHTGAVDSIAWSPDGTMIASGSRDKTVQVWEA